jgi:hypothetical protein
VLFGVLLAALLYAYADARRRRERNEWNHTLEVAVVVLCKEPRVDDRTVAELRARLPALEKRLELEAARYRPDVGTPFVFRFYGPVEVTEAPPVLEGRGITALARYAYALRDYTNLVDQAAAIDPGAFDSRIYVTASRPVNRERTWVEGESEQGGRLGQVTVELDSDMIDTTLAVIAHETFHTLGATDKYDSAGHARVPEGLADPDLVPLYPQQRAEIMARGRPEAPGVEKVLRGLDELAVGAGTAREIGWLR